MTKKVNKKKKHKQTKSNKFMKFLALAAIWASSLLMISLIYFTYDIPSAEDIFNKSNKQITLLDCNNKKIISFNQANSKKGHYTKIDEIPNHLKLAILAAEDHRFYNHFGIDFMGLLRAAFQNLKSGKIVQGGSTITQQLIKISLLSHKRSFKRKIQEFFIAINLEQKLSKDEILELYLNRIYLGPGIYGIEAAAEYYFSKKPINLSIAESAIIAGLIRSPSNLSPSKNEEASASRGFRVLEKMYEFGFITYQQFDYAQNENIIIDQTIAEPSIFYYSDWILSKIKNDFAIDEEDFEKELIVKTTLDVKLQKLAAKILEEHIQKFAHLNISQGAIIAIDEHGAVKALIGGKNYITAPYNRALYAKRHSGSTFKIFPYLTALEQGLNTNDEMIDEPISVTENGVNWQPQNYGKNFAGKVSLERAFAKSINVIAVKIVQKIGIDEVIEMARRFGIKSHLPKLPSIALGTAETNLAELTKAYASIASGGKELTIHGIKEIYENPSQPVFQQILPDAQLIDQNTQNKISKLLQKTVEYGTARSVKIKGYENQIYAKTGTSQNYKDANFIGFVKSPEHDNLTIGVWLGNDNGEPMKKVTGGKIPAKIWKAIMEKHLQH